jgi:hypothetical protein
LTLSLWEEQKFRVTVKKNVKNKSGFKQKEVRQDGETTKLKVS